ncbi:unnamed protein product [Boreogadus saida]
MDAPGSCTQPAGTAPSAARRGEPLMRACCHRWAASPRREGGLNTTWWIFRECLPVWDVEEGLYRKHMKQCADTNASGCPGTNAYGK